MSEIAIVRLPAGGEQPVHWLVYDQQSRELIASGVEASCAELGQISERIGNRPVIALVDASALSFHAVDIPAKSRRQARQVVPFALEDDVAQDIDALHFAWPSQVPTEQALPVVAVAKEQMQNWLDWLSAARLSVKALYPDVLCLPIQDSAWSVAQFEQDLLIRQGRYEGVVAQPEWLQTASILPEEAPSIIHAYGEVMWDTPPAPLKQEGEALALLMMLQEVVRAPSTPINLCQGAFAQREKSRLELGAFRFPAIAASLCLVTYLVLQAANIWQLNREAASYQQQALSAYQQLYPSVATLPANARMQVERQLASLTGQSGASLLSMLETLSPAFEEVSLTLNVMQYDQSRGELRIQANGSNFQAFERFQNAVRAVQLEVEQGQLVNRGGQIAGTLTIRSRS